MTRAGEPRPRTARESLRLQLDVAATPDRVRQIAAMFEETLRQISPALREGDVTMIVENYAAVAEVRGWQGDGERAVRLAAELVENATEAVQKHEELAGAARTLATYAAALAPHRPTFWRKGKELRTLDDVFVRTMRAAGTSTLPRVAGELVGETTVFSPVLRVGRLSEGARLRARIRVEGRFVDAAVDDQLVSFAWELASTGDVGQIRLRGHWIETDVGDLRLDDPEIIGLDAGYALVGSRSAGRPEGGRRLVLRRRFRSDAVRPPAAKRRVVDAGHAGQPHRRPVGWK